MTKASKNFILLLLAAFAVIAAACTKQEDEKEYEEESYREYLTDIWLVDLETSADSISLGEPVNITPRRGYDNQPKFLLDGSGLLFSVGVVDEEKKMHTDIYLHDLASGEQRQMTDTEEAEFSPIPMPTGRGFSVVRGEGDGASRLWFVDDQSDNSEVILPDAVGVSYYNWIDANRLVLLMGAPESDEKEAPWVMKLQIGYVNYGEVRPIIDMPKFSRALQVKPGTNSLTLLREIDEEEVELSLLDLDSLEFTSLVKPRAGSHFRDFVWTEDPFLLMADGKVIFRLVDDDWVMVRDYSDVLPGPITRLAVRPDNKQLAMVVWEVPLDMPEKK
jgi:hypothetical protein